MAIPWEPVLRTYSDALGFYRERAERFDTLFIGSSRVRAHVVPRVVDEVISASGRRHHSFNIGVDGLNLIELNTLVDEVLEAGPPTLKHVFMEPVFSTNLPAKNLLTRRAIYFHDLGNTSLEIRCNIALPSMRSSVGRSALAALYNLLNVGRLATTLSPELPGAEKGGVPPALFRQGLGYRSQESLRDRQLDRWRQDFIEGIDTFAVTMREGRSLERVGRFDMPCQFEAVRGMALRLREAGIQVVFLNTPGFLWLGAPLSFEAYLEEKGDPTPVLSYIQDHDDLYRPALWYDHRHLTAQGATIFSRRLAGDVLEVVTSSQGI